ncbi:MAG: isoprenylcysteine carboxylmethyltransferase family protein [Chloroflexota bacterium]
MKQDWGLDELVRHMPDFRGRRAGIIGLMGLLSFAAASIVMIGVDRLWPAWTGVGQVGMIVVGFVWTAQFFWRRKEYKRRWDDQAYRHAFSRHAVVGLPVIFAAIAHNVYLPGKRMLFGEMTPLVVTLGGYFLLTGLVLWVRSIIAFGFDNLAMLYVYFPEAGRMVESSIYALIRHPVYSGVVRVGLGLGLWRGTPFSIAFGLFMPLGLTLWVRLVEEEELIERFGEGYVSYRREVPAFWPRLGDVKSPWKFLVVGN